MQDLINQLTSKIGVNAEQAQTAIKTVVDFIKAKLPGPVASQVEKAVSGGGDDGGDGGLSDKIGGMFGS